MGFGLAGRPWQTYIYWPMRLILIRSAQRLLFFHWLKSDDGISLRQTQLYWEDESNSRQGERGRQNSFRRMTDLLGSSQFSSARLKTEHTLDSDWEKTQLSSFILGLACEIDITSPMNEIACSTIFFKTCFYFRGQCEVRGCEVVFLAACPDAARQSSIDRILTRHRITCIPIPNPFTRARGQI